MAISGAGQAAIRADGVVGELRSVPQTPSIVVNHDNVLQAAKVIADAVQNYGESIGQQLLCLQVDPPGGDVISIQAANAWNAKLATDPDSYANRVQDYLQSLQTVAANLATTAKQYGYSDQQIADAFRQQAGSTGA